MLRKVIEELTLYEKKILKALEKKREKPHLRRFQSYRTWTSKQL